MRLRRFAGAMAPFMVLGASACGGDGRTFEDKNGNPMDAAPTPDVVVPIDTGSRADTGSTPDTGNPGSDAGTADVASDVSAPIDAASDGAAVDSSVSQDAAADAEPDTSDGTSSDGASSDGASDGPLGDVYVDVASEAEAAPPCGPFGAYRCSDVYLQQCTATGWENKATCATAALCDATGGVCTTPVCQPNTHRCTGATLQICNADQNGWVDKMTCASAGLCDATGGICGTSACTPGAYQCSGAVLQQCRSDQTGWDDISTCISAGLCNATGGTCNPAVCAAGQYQCVGATLQQCASDRAGWTTVNTCATPVLCSAGTGACNAPACSAAQYRCTGATLEVCNTDQTGWTTSQVCLSQGLCDAAGSTCKPSCTNLAPLATAYSSGGGTPANQVGPAGMNDGILGCAPAGAGAGMGGWHWISNGLVSGGTAYVQYNWTEPQTFAMIHIDTANQTTGCSYGGSIVTSAGRTFKGAVVQYWNGSAWQNIGTLYNQTNDFDYVFPGGPVTTIGLRLYDVYSATLNNTPILEWQAYATTGCVSPPDP